MNTLTETEYLALDDDARGDVLCEAIFNAKEYCERTEEYTSTTGYAYARDFFDGVQQKREYVLHYEPHRIKVIKLLEWQGTGAIIERMRELGWDCCLSYQSEGGYNDFGWNAHFHNDEDGWAFLHHKSPHLAVQIAALKALGVVG